MKSFIGAALIAAAIAAEDPLMVKLNDLKNAFAQLADTPTPTIEPRKSQNLAQVESLAEAEVIAEVILEAAVIAEAEIEAEVDAEVEDEQIHADGSSTINVFNGEVENRRRPWQIERDVCQPQNGQCHPQCPEALWDRQT